VNIEIAGAAWRLEARRDELEAAQAAVARGDAGSSAVAVCDFRAQLMAEAARMVDVIAPSLLGYERGALLEVMALLAG